MRFGPESWQEVATALYENGYYEDDKQVLSLLCIGRYANKKLQESLTLVPQLTFEHMLRFIHNRLSEYLNVKAQHEQWDRDGKALWDTVDRHRNADDFIQAVKIAPR